MDIKTKYLGIELQSPIIVGSCGLSTSFDNLQKMQDSGAGAVVLKSILEEELLYDINNRNRVYDIYKLQGASYDYVNSRIAKDDNNSEKCLNVIRLAKEKLSIPIIGSISGNAFGSWVSFAKQMQEAGCDALEVNFCNLSCDVRTTSDDVERFFNDTIFALHRIIKIPIVVKISPYFTDMARFVQRLSMMGISAVTMFGRMPNFDIDIEQIKVKEDLKYSSLADLQMPLLCTFVLSKRLRCDISTSGGVQTCDDVVKLLLAGAKTTQVVSCLYKNGIEYIKTLNHNLVQWMEFNEYESVNDFCGKLSIETNALASQYQRIQFIKQFSGIE